MKKTILLAAGTLALLMAAGVAWAAVIQCQGGTNFCVGTTRADTMTGTNGADKIRARAGGDTVKGFGSNDEVQGGNGVDRVLGNGGNDDFVFGGEAGTDPDHEGPFTDESDDEVLGGPGNDGVVGGFAQGGRDSVFGGEGDDIMQTNQRGNVDSLGVKATKETIDCGKGVDTAVFDQGLDEVDVDDCEFMTAVPPGGLPQDTARVPGLPFE